MFLNLTPYLTWLGIMLTSKPHDLQNRLNILSNPNPALTATTTDSTTKPSTASQGTTHPFDFFLCSDKPRTRYPHLNDCTKYYDCSNAQTDIVPPTKCPGRLYFSPEVLVCTTPQEAGCAVATTTTRRNNGTSGTTTTPDPNGTPFPSASWLSQVQNFYPAVIDDTLRIYYSRNIPSPQTLLWPISFIRSMWDNIFMMYGGFGPDNRLHFLLRGRPLSQDLNYATYLDSSTGNVNAIEVGSADWTYPNSTNVDLITRNLAAIVSKSARGVRYPGTEPNWADIFVYDLYTRTGRTADRDRWEALVRQQGEENIASIPLFTQWYFPIYQMYGGGSVLNRFLIARESYFPKAQGDNSSFLRAMNRGEFVHFWSGAAGANLANLAASVFGWSTELNEQFQRARTDFSALNY